MAAWRFQKVTRKIAGGAEFEGPRLSMLTFVKSSSSVLIMISSMVVPICNHLHARQAQGINNHFLQGYLSLTPTCAGLLESRGSRLGLLKSIFHAENFIRRLSWSISSHFGAIHSSNACRSAKIVQKIHQKPFFGGSRSFKVKECNYMVKHSQHMAAK